MFQTYFNTKVKQLKLAAAAAAASQKEKTDQPEQ
jgi:hypothetical protein